MNTSPLLTVEQVAEHLALPAESVRVLIRTRQLLAVNVGTPRRKNYRVEPAALAAYLDARRTTPLRGLPVRSIRTA